MLSYWNSSWDLVFDDILNGFNTPKPYTPSLDVRSSDTDTILTLDIPGVKKEDLNIQIERSILTISGKRKTPEKRFSRAFSIQEASDTEKMTADLTDGVLTVTIPRKRAEIRQIPVSVS